VPIYLILGPVAALLGVGAIFFVVRHKSVQTKSMYSSRRAQIEHKVRSARARTLGPEKKPEVVKAPLAPAVVAAATAPTIIAPPSMPGPPDEAPKQRWDRGPTTPEPSPPAPPPPMPDITPAPLEPVWTPTSEPARSVAPALNANAGNQAWSIVGEEKQAEPEPAGKGKHKKGGRGGSGWELASGQEPGQEPDDEVKRPSAVIAFAQYAVLVVGFVMVLIGVMVMIANSKVS
jgi:hypothetical protein